MSQRFPTRPARKQNRRLRSKSGRSRIPAFILGTAIALVLPQIVKAQILWDPDGNSANPTFGGSGDWNTTSLFWDTNFDGNNQAWVNNTPVGDFARFQGTPGQVRITAPIVARLLDFAVPGYELTSNGNPANTLTLAGSLAGFLLQSGRLEVSAQILSLPDTDILFFENEDVGDGLRLDDTTPNLDGLSGTLVLTNPNNLYRGVTTITAGVLETTNLTNIGSPSSIGVGGPALIFDEIFGLVRNTNPYITLDGGTLSYTGSGTGTDRTFSITNRGGGIDSSGTGASLGFSLPSAGVNSLGAGSRTLTLSGTNTAFNNIASPMGNPSSGTLGIVKDGPGTWVTHPGNVYTGSTTINGGTLIVTSLGGSSGASGVGASDERPQNLVLNGGTLRFTGTTAGAASTDRSFTLGPNGGRIEASGSVPLSFTSVGTAAVTGSGDRTLTLGGLALDNIMRVQLTDPTTVWVLTGANTMARFNVGSPEVIDQTVTITNLQAGENLHSLDFDPITGDLYAMGTTSTGTVNRLYKVNLPAAGATTTTAASFAPVTGLDVGSAVNYGFDFDPVTGSIRLVTNTDKSFQFTKTGVLTMPASPDLNPATANVIGLAYSNNFLGAPSTTLYGIDSTADTLVTIDPTTGAVTTVGSLNVSSKGWNIVDVSGIDIASNGAAYGMFQEGTLFRFANIDLLTGGATLVGLDATIGAAAVRDLSVVVNGKTSLLKTGAGSWTLDRDGRNLGNTYTGTTTIAQGKLTLNFNADDTPDTHLISPLSPLVMSGGTLAITGKAGTALPTAPPAPGNFGTRQNVQTFNGLTLLPGGSVIGASLAANNIIELTLGTLSSRPAFATVDFPAAPPPRLLFDNNPDPGITENVFDPSTILVHLNATNDSTGILGAWATAGGTNWAAMSGGDVVAYTGYTNVELGGVIANGSSHVRLTGGTGNITLGATTTTINTLNQSHTAAATIANPGRTLRLGAIGGILVANQALTIGTAVNSGILTAGGTDNTAGELILHNNSAALLTINSVIANNGSGAVSLVNAGSGITVLNGVNTYTGNTVLNGGSLFIGDNRALSTSTIVVNSSTTPALLASSSTAGREIRNDFILNSDLQFVDSRTTGATGVGGLVIRGAINLTGGERVITVNQANGYVTLDGTITNGSLVKSGVGALAFNDLALSNVSSITLAQGSLDLWSPDGLGNTPIYVISGANAALSASGAFYSPVTSNIFLGGNLTLGRPQISDGIDLGAFIDLSNSTFLTPRIISAGGANAQQQQRLSGTLVNGTLGKGGSGELIFSSTTSTYEGGTVIFSTTTGSTLRVTPSARLGANSLGNDIYVVQDPSSIGNPALVANSFALLRLESIDNIQSSQAVTLSNFSTTAMPLLGWGSAFEANPDAVGFIDSVNGSVFTTGLSFIRVYSSPDGRHGTPGPVGIAIDGISSGVDVIGKVIEDVPFAGVWLGATARNGVYAGSVINAGADSTYRLGGGGGTLTIANANVLTGASNVITGSYDQTARGITGTVFLPQAQDFSGVLTVGTGVTLVAGLNAALGTGFSPIYLANGTLNLRSTGAHASTDSQYANRHFAFLSTATMNIDPLGGGQNGRVEIGGLDFSTVAQTNEFVLAANPTFVTNISNNFDLRVTGDVILVGGLPQTPTVAATTTFQVNSGFLTIESSIGQSETGSTGANLTKTGGGTLILTQPSTHTGITTTSAGTLVLTRPDIISGPMRLGASVLSLRSDSLTPVTYGFSNFALTGVGSIFVGPISPTGVASYSGTTMRLPDLTTGTQTGLTVNGVLNSGLQVVGATTLGANFTLTVNSARTELLGVVQGGAFNLTKAGIGTLVLSGKNNLSGNTVITQGTIIANHDTAGSVDTFGTGTISFTGTNSGGILLAGARTLSKSIALDSLGGVQVLGGFDAGNKTFSGNLTITGGTGNNGVTLTAEAGSTVNFTGVISGGGSTGAVTIGSLSGNVLIPVPGTPALGRGTVVLNPSGTAGNTFALPLVVNNGTLIGLAQATAGTSPFGDDNAITINHGILQLNGRASNTDTAHGALTVSGGARLVVNDPSDAFTTQFSVASLTRAGNGTLTLAPIGNTGQEIVNVASAPALVNGILPPWVLRAGSGGGDFLTLNAGNLTTASYTSGNLDAATSTQVFNVTTGGPLTLDRAVYALKSGVNIDLGGKTLRVGDTFATGASVAGAEGGVILDGGANIGSGTLDFGQAEGVIYVGEATTSTISAAITGTAGLVGVTPTDVRTITVAPNQMAIIGGSAIITGLPSTARIQPGTLVTGAGIPANTFVTAILSPTSVQLSAAPTASSATGAAVPLTFTGGSSLNKVGGGTLILSASNTYRGNTVVNEGTLAMGAANAIGRYTNNGLLVPSNVTIGSRGVLDLNDLTTEIGALSGAFGAVVDVGSGRLVTGRSSNTLGITSTFSGQLLGTAGSVLQKVGPGTLLLDNTRADANASTFAGSIFVDQGGLSIVVADRSNGSAFAVGRSLASVSTITLRGGTLNLLTSADNTTSNQNIVGGYNIVVTGANSTLNPNRFGGTETGKLIELGTLTLGRNELVVNTNNSIGVSFMGVTTLTDHARINTNDLTLMGKVTDNGAGFTLNKVGGNFFINNPLNDYSGGTVITGGNLFFGSRGPDVVRYPGFGFFVPSDQARAGTGPIVVNTNSVINLTDRENLAVGQTVRLFSGTTTNGNNSGFVIQTDRPVSEFNLRTLGRGSLQIGVQNGTYTTPIDMSKIGDGEWGLTTGRSVETLYTAPTLGAGAGNVFRFFGSNGAAFVIMEKNAVTGTGTVELGRGLTDLGGNAGQANASIRFMLDQNYTGKTVIHRAANAAGSSAAALDFRGTLASGTSAANPIEVYGRLLAVGAGTFTNSETAQLNVNTNIQLRPGGELALDYNNNASNATTFLVPLGTTSATGFLNKWGDSQPIVLDGATLRVTSAPSALTTEVIGAVTYKGAAEIFPQSAGTGGNAVVILNGALTRVNLGTMAFRTTAGQFGASGEPGTTAGQRVVFESFNGNPAFYSTASGVVRGVVKGGSANGTVIPMVPARFYSNTANTFLDYAGIYVGDPFNPNNFQPTTVLGFSDVPFTTRLNETVFNNGGLNNGTEIIDHITNTSPETNATTVNPGADIWALRTNIDIGSSSTTNSITIRSGGLAVTDAGTIFAPIIFRNGTTAADNVEADVWTVSGTVSLRGTITAQNLVKTGAGTLIISANNTGTLAGAIQVNGGVLELGGLDAAGNVITAAQALGSVTNLRLHAGNFNNAGNQMPQVNLRSNSAATYNQSITVSQFVPFATLNVDRINGTGTNQGLNVAGGLTIEGGGSSGTVLAFTNGNDFDFTSSGVTTLGVAMGGDAGTAPIGISVTNNNGTNNVNFSGRVTGPGRLVKSGNGPLILSNNSAGTPNDFSGGITINDGTLQLRNGETGTGTATGFQAAGTGSILLNRGTLQVLSNVTANFANLNTNNLTIAGHGILLFDRLASGTPVLSLGGDAATFTTQNSTNIQINSAGSTGGGVWAGKTVINDSPTFNVAQTSFTLGNGAGGDSITGSGHIYKTGANVLVFNSGGNTNTFSGGIDIFQGQVRIASNAAETFGTGPIRISPSGILGVTNVANVTSNTQVANFHSNSTSFAGLALRTNNLNPTAFLDNSKITSGAGNGGLLAIDVAFSAALPSQGTLFDGNWFYGSTVGATYSGAAFAAGANSTYRLGGGGATLTLGTTTNMLSGVGNSVLLGKPNALAANGTVTFQISNSYTGGTTISRVRDIAGNFSVSQADIQRGFSDSPLGSGAVEVFGNLQFLSSGTGVLQGSAVTNGGGSNRNAINFHPGARLIFQNSVVYATTGNTEGRWADSAGIALRSSDVEMLGNTSATNGNDLYNSETVGAITFSGGSEIRMVRGAANLDAQLVTPSLTRVGNGTITIVHGATGSLGLNSYSAGAPAGTGILGTGSDLITIGDRAGLVDPNGMVKPFIVDRTENNFVFYDAASDSLRTITQALADTNGIPYTTNAAATVALDNPNAILDNNAAATLTGVTDIYALRIQQDLSSSANGQFNTVTIRSGGLTISGGTARTIHANLNFGTAASPAEALIHASSINLTINGQMSASAITKFGVSSLTINQDQPLLGPSVPWNINQGQVIVQTPGALGSGPVFLNGWTGNTGQTVTELRFVFNPGTPEELSFSSGKITSLDFNLIRAQTANDRTVRIAALDLTTTNTVKGTGVPGVMWLRVDGARSTMNTGAMTMFDDYVLQVDATSFGPGSTSGVRPDSINNAGLYNLTKIGDGVLILGDNSSTFTGAGKTFTVNESAVKVLHNGSLGGLGTTAIIDNGGALEIAKTAYSPTGMLVQRAGSIERWSVNGARSGAVVPLPDGVHLQIAASQTGTQTINLNGGSIMGYLPVDVDEIAVVNSLGANVSVNVQKDSMLGQPYPAGTNVVGGGVNHVYYDMGKQNQLNNPLNPVLNGAVLDIRGTISGQTGAETLTKVGSDVVQFSGNNNVGNGFNTHVREGMLVLGSSNALPATKALTVAGNGTLDLNGFNATTGTLAGSSPNSVIANSATTTRTLTVNGGSSYAGGLTGNLEFKYNGGVGNTFTLSGAHTHSGATTAQSGTLVLTGSATGTATFKANGGATLNVTNANGVPNSFQLTPGQTLAGGDGTSTPGMVLGTVTAKTGSTIAPGFELGLPGILQINTGNLTLESGSIFKLELAGYVAGSGYDQLVVNNGSLNLGGATLDLTAAGGTVLTDQVYYIVQHNTGTTTGIFAGLPQGSLLTANGYEFQISYTANAAMGEAGFASTTGNDVALLVTIPEPGSLAGLCAGLGTLLGLRRFRRRSG